MVGLAVGFSVAPTATLAAPITFAGPADYDNNAAQRTGVFRDFLNGALINQGNDLGGTGHTALNFTGSDNNAALAGRITLYDTSPSTTVPTTFSGNLSISADILIHPFNNAKGAGVLFLFNEGAGQNGLALHLWNAGNSDSNKIELVAQTGEARPGAALATVALREHHRAGSLVSASDGSAVQRFKSYRKGKGVWPHDRKRPEQLAWLTDRQHDNVLT